MNSESNKESREQLEIRVVAMLLGEASDFETAELQQVLANDPELATFHDRMKQTLGLVKESAKAAAPSAQQPKLSAERRQILMNVLKNPAGKVVPVPKTEKEAAKEESGISRLLVWGSLAACVVILAGMMLPALSKARYRSERIAALNRARMAEMAEEQRKYEAQSALPTATGPAAAVPDGKKSNFDLDAQFASDSAGKLQVSESKFAANVFLPGTAQEAGTRRLTQNSPEASGREDGLNFGALATTNSIALNYSAATKDRRFDDFSKTTPPSQSSAGQGGQASDDLYARNELLRRDQPKRTGGAEYGVAEWRPQTKTFSTEKNTHTGVDGMWYSRPKQPQKEISKQLGTSKNGRTPAFSGGYPVATVQPPPAESSISINDLPATGRLSAVNGSLRRGVTTSGTFGDYDTTASGKSVDVKVMENGSLSGIYPVQADGSITVPGVGSVAVADEDLAKTEKTIKEGLQQSQLKDVTVTVDRVEAPKESTELAATKAPPPQSVADYAYDPQWKQTEVEKKAAEKRARAEKQAEEKAARQVAAAKATRGARVEAEVARKAKASFESAQSKPALVEVEKAWNPATKTELADVETEAQRKALTALRAKESELDSAKPRQRTTILASKKPSKVTVIPGAKSVVSEGERVAGQIAAGGKLQEETKNNETLPLIVINEAPLPDAISSLARQANISIQFEPQVLSGALAAGAKPASSPGLVNFRQENVTPNQALHTVLDNYGLELKEDPATKVARVVAKGAATSQAIPREEDKPLPKKIAPPATPQPEIATRDNAFSTFSLNVSDVSFKLAAAALQNNTLPDAASIRVEEFINAFNYRDPAPAPGARLAFAWERARYPFAHNRDIVRFSVQTAARGRDAQKPLNLVILLDNSGSMERPDRVAILREALNVLAKQLHPQDRISVITFARTARLIVDGIAGEPNTLLSRVLDLNPEGGTNLEEAMNLGYATAARHFMPNGVNRVILLTDGAANLGNIEPEELKQKVVEHRQKGIALDCFGIGWEGYNDDLLEVLSRNGDGRYGFINKPEQAGPEFAEQLAGALNVAASDVKTQVEFNPNRVTSWRQIGYAKHQLTKEQFRDNTVDAAEIAAAEQGNALYVIETNPQGNGPIGVVRVRFKVPETGEYLEQEWPLEYQPRVPALNDASPAMRLAVTASAFGEWLSQSPYAAEVTLPALQSLLNGVPENFSPDPRPQQLGTMIQQARAVSGK